MCESLSSLVLCLPRLRRPRAYQPSLAPCRLCHGVSDVCCQQFSIIMYGFALCVESAKHIDGSYLSGPYSSMYGPQWTV